MSYSTPSEVKSLFRNFSSNSEAAVEDHELQQFLDDNFSLINSKVGTLYTLPITSGASPESYKILAMIEKYLVAEIVDDILNSYSEADKKPDWGKRARMMLNSIVPDLVKGVQPVPTMKLIDADYLGTSTQKNRISVAATSGRIFTKGGDNW